MTKNAACTRRTLSPSRRVAAAGFGTDQALTVAAAKRFAAVFGGWEEITSWSVGDEVEVGDNHEFEFW